MENIGYAALQIIPSLRGVREAILRATRNLNATVDVDVSGAREAGARAGRDVRSGMQGARIADGLHRQVDEELSAANAKRTGSRFGSSLGASILSSVRSIGSGFDQVASHGMSILRNIGAIATGTKIASVAAQVLSRSLLGASTALAALAALGGGGVGRLAAGLGLVSRAAGGAARDIGRITSSLIVLYGVGRGLSLLSNIGKYAAVGTIGLTALLGVATGVASLLGGPMVAALKAMAAAMGIAAGAAAGILGPALLSLGLGFKGMQDAVKAYTASDGGVSQAKAVATASKQVAAAEKGVERAKRDSREAEKDLTRARKDALEQIEDMNLALKGSALTERDAQLSLLEARRDLQNLGKDGQSFDMLDRERAILRVQEAEQRLAETQESNGDLAEKAAEQNRVGVEGSDEVVAAKQRVVDANQAVADAEQRVADAQQALADAQNAGQSGVDPFDLMIGQRMAPAIDAVKGLKQTVTDSLTTALVPAFSTFGALIDGMKPKVSGLSTLFGGIGTDVTNALAGPVAKKGFDDMLAASSTFFTAFRGTNGLGGLATGLVSFAGTAAKTFADVGRTIGLALGSVGERLKNISPAQMTLAFEALRKVFENIRNVVGPIFSGLKDLGGISAPALAPGFKAIGDAIKQATPGVMAMARELMPALGQALHNLAPVIPGIVNSMGPWSTVVAALAPHIGTLVAHLGPLTPLILGVALAAKGIGAAMLLWNTAAAAASIAQGVLAAATGAGTAALGTNSIALAAHKVALGVGAAATGVMSVATAAFNAVLDANPIALVVLAIAGLVAGIIYAYKHSETFRNIVQAAWTGIKTVVSAVWDWMSTTLWPGIKAAFQGIGDAAMWLWNNALKPAWEGIRSGMEVAWAAIKVVFDLWKTEWRLIGEGAMWLWNNAIAPAWEGIKTAFSGAWGFVSGIFDKFKSGWDTLKNGVVGGAQAIKDGLTEAFRGLSDIIKAPLHALGTLLEGIPTEILNITVPGADALKNWGKSLKSLSTGGYTGAIPIDQVAGVVHGGEHVIKATSRRRIENAYPGLLDFLNNNGELPMPGYAEGGRVSAAELSQFARGVEGKPYKWGGTNWGDCSGAVSAIANYATGRSPFSSRFATASEAAELAARGFKSGLGPAGSLNIGWFNGGPYGGHTAATLPDGTNFEMGGRRGNGQFGGSAAGANSPSFTDHAFLPPEFFSKAPGTGLQLDGGAPTTGTPGSGFQFSDASAAPLPSSGRGSGAGLPSSFSDAAAMPLSQLGGAITGGDKRGDQIGPALGEVVGGQVKSALGVFGVNDSPPIFQAASKLLSGVKVSGGDGSTIFDGSNPFGSFGGSGTSAAPISATSTTRAAAPPSDTGGNTHGGRAGQAPGPTYNIRTATVEDAFLQAQRQERENAAAKLSRF
ncbi:hypothetical protein [Mycobacterium sp.]|uniref:hypothetical protein n=1 Tax=Mycobacterium sp. TaxID=1785 RepID=UPI0025E84818|nr:hypothetical protein [Mycobacterium sp.]